jgi:uncharacterized protein YdaU (DUF1376 family)
MARPWYAFYPADYGRDTGHLSLVEHGAYRALLDHYYATAAPLPRDEARLLHLCRANTRAERKAVRAVLREFFRSSDAGWHHPRVDAELAKAAAVIEKCSNAARIGNAMRRIRGADAPADAPAESPPSQSQPQSQEKNDSGFAQFSTAGSAGRGGAGLCGGRGQGVAGESGGGGRGLCGAAGWAGRALYAFARDLAGAGMLAR